MPPVALPSASLALLAAIMHAGVAEDSQNASATTNQSINETNNATENLTDEERYAVFEGNARRVFPRMDAALKAKGL